MKTFARFAIACAGIALVAATAGAADQLIRGRLLAVKDPLAGGPDTKRKVAVLALEKGVAGDIVGDPTSSPGGAILSLYLNGANPTSQTLVLPQGTASTGRPFWTSTGNGFKYRDPRGDNGPVRLLLLKHPPTGLFVIKAMLAGKNGQIDVIPPNPGSDGFVTLRIIGGDRYCVKYGSDGRIKNLGNRLFVVKKPVAEGCYGSPSRAFLAAPTDLLD